LKIQIYDVLFRSEVGFDSRGIVNRKCWKSAVQCFSWQYCCSWSVHGRNI